MIISKNSLIILDYDPATDILVVDLPDIRRFAVSEVERSLQMVVEAVLSYDIKKMYLDSSKAVMEVEDEQYRQIILKFSHDLTKTRLKWLARIASPIATQEARATKLAEELQRSNVMPVEFMNFSNKQEALQWLISKK